MVAASPRTGRANASPVGAALGGPVRIATSDNACMRVSKCESGAARVGAVAGRALPVHVGAGGGRCRPAPEHVLAILTPRGRGPVGIEAPFAAAPHALFCCGAACLSCCSAAWTRVSAFLLLFVG